MSKKEIIRRGDFDLVRSGLNGAQIRLNQCARDEEGNVFLTPICVTYPELEYQVNEMIDALTGILAELRKQGHTRVLFPEVD